MYFFFDFCVFSRGEPVAIRRSLYIGADINRVDNVITVHAVHSYPTSYVPAVRLLCG